MQTILYQFALKEKKFLNVKIQFSLFCHSASSQNVTVREATIKIKRWRNVTLEWTLEHGVVDDVIYCVEVSRKKINGNVDELVQGVKEVFIMNLRRNHSVIV